MSGQQPPAGHDAFAGAVPAIEVASGAYLPPATANATAGGRHTASSHTGPSSPRPQPRRRLPELAVAPTARTMSGRGPRREPTCIQHRLAGRGDATKPRDTNSHRIVL